MFLHLCPITANLSEYQKKLKFSCRVKSFSKRSKNTLHIVCDTLNFYTAENFETIQNEQSSVVGQPVYFNVVMNEGKYLQGVEFRATDCTG